MDKYERRRQRLIELRDTRFGGKAADLARAIGRDPSYVSRMLYPEGKPGKKRIADDMMELIETTLALPKGWLDPAADSFGPAIETPLRPVVVVESPEDIRHEIIEVPRYTVKASAGNGSPILDVDTEGTPNYCRSSWAHSHGYNPKNLFSIVATGDSMEPTIPEGASLIVHRQHDVVNGKVHIICRKDECFVKRLYKQMDEALLIHSDNEKKYSSITVHKDDPDQVHIVGLVVSMSTNL